jgi:hypothetical protein
MLTGTDSLVNSTGKSRGKGDRFPNDSGWPDNSCPSVLSRAVCSGVWFDFLIPAFTKQGDSFSWSDNEPGTGDLSVPHLINGDDFNNPRSFGECACDPLVVNNGIAQGYTPD